MKHSIALLAVAAALLLAFTGSVPAMHAQNAVHFYAHHPLWVVAGPFMDPAGPPPTVETPGSMACVYKLVKQTKGCPRSSNILASGGVGAIALVDAFDNPNAVADIKAYAAQYGIKKYSFKVVFASGHRPQSGEQNGWALEEALDIEMAVAMAPKAKIYLVEADTNSDTDLYFAETVAAKLVVKAGGGVISNSWQGGEYSGEDNDGKKYFNQSGVVYFASSGDGGYNHTGFPAVSPNVIAAGGTWILRDGTGKFTNEVYWSGGGSGLSQFEPRPTYQNIIKKIVGSQRGVPDFSAIGIHAGVYHNGGWFDVGGTSISSPLLAGIVNAAGSKAKSTAAELTQIYKDYANKTTYKAEFRDIVNPPPNCKKGWDLCDGVGSPTTYKGK